MDGFAHMCWAGACCTGSDYSDEKPSALFLLAACYFLKCSINLVYFVGLSSIYTGIVLNTRNPGYPALTALVTHPPSIHSSKCPLPDNKPHLLLQHQLNHPDFSAARLSTPGLLPECFFFQQPAFSHLVYCLSAFSAK